MDKDTYSETRTKRNPIARVVAGKDLLRARLVVALAVVLVVLVAPGRLSVH